MAAAIAAFIGVTYTSMAVVAMRLMERARMIRPWMMCDQPHGSARLDSHLMAKHKLLPQTCVGDGGIC
jgi:hypothetical protein